MGQSVLKKAHGFDTVTLDASLRSLQCVCILEAHCPMEVSLDEYRHT